MQRIIFLACVLVCSALSLNAQSIRGEGDVVKQEIDMETITGVQLGFHGDIILTQGSRQKVVLEGQQNILDNIKREVKNGTWKVYSKKHVRNAKPVKVYITMAKLNVASVSGSGMITATNSFNGIGDLEVAVSGSGDVVLDISADDVGSHISGSGKIHLSGSADLHEVHISGSGDVEADDLRSTDCTVHISGSGNAKVHATGSLEATVSGSGDVRYKGNAAKVRSRVSGSGNVREM